MQARLNDPSDERVDAYLECRPSPCSSSAVDVGAHRDPSVFATLEKRTSRSCTSSCPTLSHLGVELLSFLRMLVLDLLQVLLDTLPILVDLAEPVVLLLQEHLVSS